MNDLVIQIDKDRPMPLGRFSEGTADMALLRDTFSKMQVGDSFLWPKANNHAYLAAKHIGARITCRKQVKGGWRIWLRGKPTKQIQ